MPSFQKNTGTLAHSQNDTWCKNPEHHQYYEYNYHYKLPSKMGLAEDWIPYQRWLKLLSNNSHNNCPNSHCTRSFN
jgi:hypothetical protein